MGPRSFLGRGFCRGRGFGVGFAAFEGGFFVRQFGGRGLERYGTEAGGFDFGGRDLGEDMSLELFEQGLVENKY